MQNNDFILRFLQNRIVPIKVNKFLWLIFAAIICLGVGAVSVKAADGNVQDVISTDLANEGNIVTLRVNISEKTMITNGRIKVYYPADLLKLAEVKEGKTWRAADTNVDLKENEKRGVSYAWADTKGLLEGGNLLTVTMETTDLAAGKEITVETEIVELFSEEKVVAAGSYRRDTLRLNDGEEPPSDSEKETPSVDGNNTSAGISAGTSISTGAAVRTGDNANPAGYVLLGMWALLVMTEQVKKKMTG